MMRECIRAFGDSHERATCFGLNSYASVSTQEKCEEAADEAQFCIFYRLETI